MRFKAALIHGAILCLCAVLLQAQDIPRMTDVSPNTAKVGDILTVEGENLAKPNVVEVYLTDGKNDTKMEVTEQTATSMKVKVPDSAKPGSFRLMVLTGGAEPKLMEQPVRVTIE